MALALGVSLRRRLRHRDPDRERGLPGLNFVILLDSCLKPTAKNAIGIVLVVLYAAVTVTLGILNLIILWEMLRHKQLAVSRWD